VPDIRTLTQKVPFFIEGTLSIDEPLTMMMEHNPLVDFQGQTPAGDFTDVFVQPDEEERYAKSADSIIVATGKKWDAENVRLPDLVKRREVHFSRIAKRYFAEEHSFRDFQRFIGEYQRGEPRLLANPVDPEDPMVRHGQILFENATVACSQCHPAPAFTDKVHAYNENGAFPPLVSPVARDNVHTLISADRLDLLNGFERPWDPDDPGRIEAREGFFAAPSLRGLWARPPKFLHHGHAVSLREVICTPDHPALRTYSFERRATSHLSVWDIECLLAYLRSIE